MSKLGGSNGGGGSWGGKGKRSSGGSESLEGLLKGLKLSEEELSKVKGARRAEGREGAGIAGCGEVVREQGGV